MGKQSLDKASELALAQAVANGDKLAMRQIYEAYAGPLGSFVKNWLGDPTQAADLVHETMLEVWRNAGRFEGRSSLKSWIFSIARNKSIDTNRNGARLSYSDEVPEIEDTQLSSEDVLAAAQDAKMLRNALSELSDVHRRVLHLSFFENLKYEEIAKIEGCPVGTIKTRIMHAKKKLLYVIQKNQK